jgi:hypothetical protein
MKAATAPSGMASEYPYIDVYNLESSSYF